MNLLAFFVALVLSFLLTPLVFVALEKAKILDHPSGGRKIHRRPIPVGGGVAIYLAFFGAIVLLAPWQETALLEVDTQMLGLVLAATCLVVAGLWDDARGMKPRRKLLAQATAGWLLFTFGFRIGVVTNPLGGQIILGWWDLPLTVLWVVSLCNAINLIDGLDGLACGVAVIAATTLGLIGIYPADYSRDAPFLCFALAGAALGFLRFNYHPAKVFLGDTGSMLLGLLLSAIALTSARKSSTAIALLMPLVSLGVPVIDTLLAILRRAISGSGIFTADGKHLHHRLLKLGISHEDVVKVFYFISVWLGLVAFMFVLIPNQFAIIVFGVLGMGLLFAIKSLSFLEAVVHGRPHPRSVPLSAPLRWFSRRVLERPAALLERWSRRVLKCEERGATREGKKRRGPIRSG